MPEEPGKRTRKAKTPEEPNKRTWRERFNEARENMRDNQAVQWARDNRTTIGVGAGCFAFGFLLRSKPHVTEINNTVTPVFNNHYVVDGLPVVEGLATV